MMASLSLFVIRSIKAPPSLSQLWVRRSCVKVITAGLHQLLSSAQLRLLQCQLNDSIIFSDRKPLSFDLSFSVKRRIYFYKKKIKMAGIKRERENETSKFPSGSKKPRRFLMRWVFNNIMQGSRTKIVK